MAATGYSPIQLYYSTTASAAPTAGNLASGELAINITDGKLYYKDNAGAVQLLSTSTTANGTANGVLYLNASKVATAGSALVFDGTNLGVGTSSPAAPLSFASATGQKIRFYNGLSGYGIGVESSEFRFVTDNSASFTWGIGTYSSPSEQMRLTSTGLGIGTSSPVQKLHVAGNVYVTGDTFRIKNSASNTAFIRAEENASTAAYTYATMDGRSTGYWSFSTNDTERMRLDASGNLGLGVTPSAWYSTYKALQISSNGSFSTNTDFFAISNNAYTNTSANDIYLTTGYAGRYRHVASSGAHQWFIAPSGTAGDVVTFTQAMTLDASGNLLLGTTTNLSSSFRASIEGGRLGVASASNAYALYLRYNNTTSGFYIGSPSADTLSFSNNAGTEVARIESSGNLLVGTTAAAYNSGERVSINGASTKNGIGIAVSGAGAKGIGIYNGNSTGATSGTMLEFQNSSSVVIGSITSNGTATAYNTSSDQRLKENIADADSASEFIDSLKVRKYDWKSDGSHQRYGFIAQELVTVAPEAVHQPADPEEMMAVDYSKLVPMLVKEIQSLRKRLADAGIA